jgi:hypothetical protein
MITVPFAALEALPLAVAELPEAAPVLLLVVLLALLHAAAASSVTPSAAPNLPAAGNRVTNDLPIVIIPWLG